MNFSNQIGSYNNQNLFNYESQHNFHDFHNSFIMKNDENQQENEKQNKFYHLEKENPPNLQYNLLSNTLNDPIRNKIEYIGQNISDQHCFNKKDEKINDNDEKNIKLKKTYSEKIKTLIDRKNTK